METQNLSWQLRNVFPAGYGYQYSPSKSVSASIHWTTRFTCSSDSTHSRACTIPPRGSMSRYGSVLNLVGSRYEISPIPGREGELLRTYLITRHNESKLVIYDFNGEARNSIPDLINRGGPQRGPKGLDDHLEQAPRLASPPREASNIVKEVSSVPRIRSGRDGC